MKYNDLHFCKDYYFSLGVTDNGIYYISIPVSNRRVDYEEFYQIDKTFVDGYPSNLEEVKEIASHCRKHLRDKFLLEKPGADRGEPMWPKAG